MANAFGGLVGESAARAERGPLAGSSAASPSARDSALHPSLSAEPVDWATLGRFDPFRALSEQEKRSQKDGYRGFLRERDGALDFERRILPQREAAMRLIEAEGERWTGEADRDAFYEHYYGPGRTPLDARTNFLLALSAFNVNEIWAIEGEIARWKRRGLDGADPIVLYDLLEEQYHGRILIEACRASGLGDVRIKAPRWLSRQLIRVMQHFPDGIRYVGILCGEVLGCVMLRVLLKRLDLFADQPRVQSRIRFLLEQILLDETGHVLYCRASVPDWSLALSRRAVVPICQGLMREIPQMAALGVTHRELYARLSEGLPIPPSMAAWLPAESGPTRGSAGLG